jgi:signal peptidase I
MTISTPRRRRSHWLLEVVLVVVIALVVSVLVRAFVAQAFYIPSSSMADTLQQDDWILVSKVGYQFGSPQRGDVVVFEDPGDWLEQPAETTNVVRRALEFIGVAPDSSEGDLVKRVIGVGGDTVSCCDAQGRVRVNGVALDEQYVAPGDEPGDAPIGCSGEFVAEVPLGYLWVMGDHRAVSSDSRCQKDLAQFVPEENVHGRTVAVIWPVSEWALVDRPDTFDAVE